MKKKYNIDCVYIDHLHHLGTNSNFFNDVQKLSYMAEELKKSARILKIPHVVLAQIHRMDNSNERPTISNIKGSGKIEEVADIIMLLHCSQKAYDGDNSRKVIEIIYDKNRCGKIGLKKFIFCVDSGRYEPLINYC